MAIERLAFEVYSAFEEADRSVIRNPIEWAIVWAQVNKTHSPTEPPLPAIDFSKEQVVVAALGRRPSTGYGIGITGASRTGDRVTVKIESRLPGSGCGGLTVITHPVEVAKMPRTIGSVGFEETPIVKDCS